IQLNTLSFLGLACLLCSFKEGQDLSLKRLLQPYRVGGYEGFHTLQPILCRCDLAGRRMFGSESVQFPSGFIQLCEYRCLNAVDFRDERFCDVKSAREPVQQFFRCASPGNDGLPRQCPVRQWCLLISKRDRVLCEQCFNLRDSFVSVQQGDAL